VKARHTPGPWYVEPEKHFQGLHHVAGRGPVVRDTNDKEIVRCLAGPKEANACLIAAAPDLLAAAYAALNYIAECGREDDGSPSEIAAPVEADLRAAIRKAKGE
jgi:hypothetical protein